MFVAEIEENGQKMDCGMEEDILEPLCLRFPRLFLPRSKNMHMQQLPLTRINRMSFPGTDKNVAVASAQNNLVRLPAAVAAVAAEADNDNSTPPRPGLSALELLASALYRQWRNQWEWSIKRVAAVLSAVHIRGATHLNSTAAVPQYYVYEVLMTLQQGPLKEGKRRMGNIFWLRTAQALLEFKCKNKNPQQKWLMNTKSSPTGRVPLKNSETS
nr:VAN3-binding protein isoform X1 [Ipomoea batatas]